MELEEKAIRNHNGHGNGNRPSMEPMATNFIRPEQAPAAAEGETPAKPTAPGTVVFGGEEYV